LLGVHPIRLRQRHPPRPTRMRQPAAAHTPTPPPTAMLTKQQIHIPQLHAAPSNWERGTAAKPQQRTPDVHNPAAAPLPGACPTRPPSLTRGTPLHRLPPGARQLTTHPIREVWQPGFRGLPGQVWTPAPTTTPRRWTSPATHPGADRREAGEAKTRS